MYPLEETTKAESEKEDIMSEEKISIPESKVKSPPMDTLKPKPDKKKLSKSTIPQKKQEIIKQDKKQKEGKIITSKKKPEETAEESKPETEESKKPEISETTKPIVEKKPEPPKPISKEGDTVTKADTDAIPRSTPDPIITRKIRKSLKSSETIVVSFLIDQNGNVEKIKLIKRSNSPDLNLLIYSTVGNWKYKPAIKDNVRVKIWKTKTISIKK